MLSGGSSSGEARCSRNVPPAWGGTGCDPSPDAGRDGGGFLRDIPPHQPVHAGNASYVPKKMPLQTKRVVLPVSSERNVVVDIPSPIHVLRTHTTLPPLWDPLAILGFIFKPNHPEEMLWGGERHCHQLLIICLSCRKKHPSDGKVIPQMDQSLGTGI